MSQQDLTAFPPPPFVNSNWRIGIVHTLYHAEYIHPMVQGAKDTLVSADIPEKNILEFPVVGAFEVPLIGAALADKKRVDALIGFGVIVQGATAHANHLAEQTARALMDIQLKYAIPFAYEILHVQSLDQVIERNKGAQNKGIEAALASLHSLAQLSSMQS